ncbi:MULTISPECIES: ABC transporter substrate-binding protein [Rhodococcus]|jgi:iron complex transport system substrate-binding protein|uniref:ABC transporter substrate-binding protein n=1 Tax=Rhodococcus rhodochrous TaxID=1829 RepID=A0AA46X4N3_RHORH|nr:MULTISPECIES: ABC transporter substrate-binding protein [Rhodococcus]AYA23393.1 iron ABC transporter substrate-binding protein [Rhodococcus rhodochrous]MCB8913779.1 ABC transporter substrate-binding protein [Rhodococcus rhodochrous]MDC3728049.1 ABC transporter substrate-binding protein [Rhodococcus sp. Rp3]TWH44446.1 iron complex transport system substrate-binding protein [Rhodococcus rhodochrous J38]UZF48151.1 ABC transporter substrate-binding protein [Rhodococcus rhodochrous]
MLVHTPSVRRIIALTSIASAVLLSAGCSRGTTTAEAEAAESFREPVTITNCERTATFDAPPQRIISMNDHVTETLIQMGVGDRIVGMGYGEQPDPLPETAEQFRAIPSLAKEYPTSEQVLDLEPDLIVGGMRSAFDDKNGLGRDSLEAAGIATFLFSEYCGQGFPDISLLENDFAQLGAILGVEESATALTEGIVAGLDTIRACLDAAGAQPVRTFFYDSGEAEPLSVGGVGIGNLIGDYAGIENITAEGPKPYFATSWEVVGERQPEAIVVLDYGSISAADKIAFLRNHPVMATTPAVRNDRFVVVPLDDFFESSRMVASADTIARALHPEAFAG